MEKNLKTAYEQQALERYAQIGDVNTQLTYLKILSRLDRYMKVTIGQGVDIEDCPSLPDQIHSSTRKICRFCYFFHVRNDRFK